jgi:hypothetical protein
MHEREFWLGSVRSGGTLQSVFQGRRDEPVAHGVQLHGPGTCGFQAGVPVAFAHVQDAKTGAVDLLWMLALSEQMLDDSGGVRTDVGCPAKQPLRVPFGRCNLMMRRHVRHGS